MISKISIFLSKQYLSIKGVQAKMRTSTFLGIICIMYYLHVSKKFQPYSIHFIIFPFLFALYVSESCQQRWFVDLHYLCDSGRIECKRPFVSQRSAALCPLIIIITTEFNITNWLLCNTYEMHMYFWKLYISNQHKICILHILY